MDDLHYDNCEFCTLEENPTYELTLGLSGKGWSPLHRTVQICADCIDAMFFPEPAEADSFVIPNRWDPDTFIC